MALTEQAEHPDAPTILICDDEESLRELIRAVLGPEYRYVEAADGAEALELARAEPPDLMILDVMLPRLNGLEVLSELRRDERLRDLPVIVVTAWSHAAEAAAAAGADVFLAKPFEPDYLAQTVEDLVA